MKKVLVSLLCLTMLVCLFTVNVHAANDIEFAISGNSANRGETVDVTVAITKNPGITFIAFDVKYDQTVLQLEKVTNPELFGGRLSCSKNITDYPYRISFVDGLEDYNATGDFAILTFKVLDAAAYGDSSIQVTKPKKGAPAGNIIDDVFYYPETTDGKVEIICPHTNAAKVEAVAPDCTTAGNIEYYHCPDCNKYFSDAEKTTEITEEETIAAALGHTKVHHDAVAPTCTEEGIIEYWECSVCKKLYSDEACTTEITADDLAVEKVAHTLGDYVTDADNHWKVCSVCNQEIDKVAHVPGEPESHTDATCTEPERNGAIKCTVCGYVISTGAELSPALGHDTVHYEKKDATCTESGNIEYWECKRCTKFYSDAEYKTEITAADTIIAALGHTKVHHPAVAPTCTVEGTIEYWECSVCNKLYSDEACTTEVTNITVPTVAHTLGDYVTDADSHWKVCSVCGQEIDKVAHVPGEPESHTDATCTEPERNGAVKCTVCGYVISAGEELSPALGHETVHYDFKDSTCTELGNIEYWECTRCGKFYSDAEYKTEITKEATVIAMKEHTYVEHPEDPADHHKSGKKLYYTCSVCNKIFDESKNETTEDALIIAQIPHDTITAWTTDGDNHWHQCSCGDKLDLAAHEPEERDHVDPTCTEAGCEGGTYCKICNKLLVEGGNVIPALGHDMVEFAEVPATCTAPGNVHYWHCNRCNLNFTDQVGTEAINNVVIPQLGHIFEEGKCKRCGAVDPNYQKTPYIVPVDGSYHGVFTTPGIMTYERHYPSVFGLQNDGVYQWHICGACGTAFNKTLIEKIDNPDDVTVTEPGDTDEITVTEPIEPGDTDEEPEDTTVNEPAPEPAPEPEDTNPKTGIVVSLTVLSCAALAVVIGKRR